MDAAGTQRWLRFFSAAMAWTAGLAPALATVSTLRGAASVELGDAPTWGLVLYFALVPWIMAYGAFNASHRLVFAGFFLLICPVVALADSIGAPALTLAASGALLAVFLSVAADETARVAA